MGDDTLVLLVPFFFKGRGGEGDETGAWLSPQLSGGTVVSVAAVQPKLSESGLSNRKAIKDISGVRSRLA